MLAPLLEPLPSLDCLYGQIHPGVPLAMSWDSMPNELGRLRAHGLQLAEGHRHLLMGIAPPYVYTSSSFSFFYSLFITFLSFISPLYIFLIIFVHHSSHWSALVVQLIQRMAFGLSGLGLISAFIDALLNLCGAGLTLTVITDEWTIHSGPKTISLSLHMNVTEKSLIFHIHVACPVIKMGYKYTVPINFLPILTSSHPFFHWL